MARSQSAFVRRSLFADLAKGRIDLVECEEHPALPLPGLERLRIRRDLALFDQSIQRRLGYAKPLADNLGCNQLLALHSPIIPRPQRLALIETMGYTDGGTMGRQDER